MRIVNAHDEEVEPGEVGELIVRTAAPGALSPGYFEAPEKTSAAWRNGWFHSGDALRVDEDGNYLLVDRYHDTIRRRGENISSFEVEAIVASHDLVQECAAVGVPGEHGDDDVVVFVIATTASGLDPQRLDTGELMAWLVPQMPPYMVPSQIRIVEDLPRNATSLRVKKYELRQIARVDEIPGGP